MPSSSAQNLMITTANLLDFSACHKMTVVQHGNLLNLSAWHKMTHKMTLTVIQHVYLTSCQILLANNKHHLQKLCLRVSVVFPGGSYVTIANSLCFRLLLCTYMYKSNTVHERALLRAQQGVSPPNMSKNISVCYFSGVFLLQEECCK